MAVGGVGARTRDDASCAVMGVTALLLALAGFASFVLQQLADEPDACFADVVVTPPKDARAYRVFELDNGLRALVVSDAQADVAAAAMSVGVGSLFDPPETAGLAHFLEHMLFTGNARYPREGEYFDFVNAHGGSTNAATGLERTHFHFSIPPAQLLPALERLLQFFISPTLAPGMTEREKHAVSAEHSKNVAQDEWRFQRIRFLTTGNPACALHKFGTGNLATLANASSDQLRAFYDAHYAPRAMGLAVVGRESLDRLEAAVRSLASHMPKKAAVTPTFDDAPGPLPPYPAHGLVAGSADARGRAVGGRQVEFEPVADAQALRLVWYLPPMRGEYARKSLAYVTELLGDEGPGSLVSLLRAERGWADALTAGASHPASFFSEVEVSISLTSDGLEHVDDVVELVFAAIGKIRATPPERWRWEEDRQLAEIEWRFLEPAQPAALAQDLSAALLDKDVPLCDALRGPYAYRHFDSAQISTVAAQLTADTLLLYVGAKGLSRGVPDAGPASALDFGTDSGWVREKYYGARFRVRPFSPEQLRAWRGADAARVAAGGEGAGGVGADLRLPPPNAFIPTDFSLVVPAAPAGSAASLTVAPELLDDSTTGRLWLYADGTFAQPRASVTCVVTAGAVLADARALWTTQLLISMATDALKERAYPAAIAGLAASVGVGIEGLELSASGFSHKLTRLLQMAASTVAPGATVRASRFEAVRAAIVRDLRAEQFAGSLANALTQLKVLVRARTASYDRLAAVRIVANLTIDDVRAHATRLVSAGSYTECLVAGNVREQHALGAFATVRAALGGPPLASGALANLRQRVLSVPVGDHLWQADALDPDEINSAVALYYEVGSTASSLRDEACLELLVMLVQQAAFDQLRTDEQLGYTIGAQAYRAWSAQAVLLYARSDAASTDYLDERFEAFLTAHAAVLRGTSDAKLQTTRAALVANLGARDRSLADRTTRLWSELEMHDCVFDRAARLREHARNLTLVDVLELYERTFLDRRTRRKLAVRVRAPGESSRPTPRRVAPARGESGQRASQYRAIASDGVEAWRAGCELLPAPTTCDAFAQEAAAM